MREAIATVEATGRDALTELRRVAGVPRQEGEDPGVDPQPGVADVPALVARTRGAGLSVELAMEGEPRPLPGGVDLSACWKATSRPAPRSGGGYEVRARLPLST